MNQTFLAPFVARSYVPYSKKKSAAMVICADGTWMPGVRVENISFPLTISPLMNAVTAAVAIGKTNIVGAYFSDEITAWDESYIQATLKKMPQRLSAHLLAWGTLPDELGEMLSPFQNYTFQNIDEIFLKTREITQFAYIPHSNFPVGALLKIEENLWLQGCNVEADDWGVGLCGERNVLSTALTFGVTGTELYISCPKALDQKPTPCGGCRQVIAEHFVDKKILIDMGVRPAQIESSASLLPQSFKADF